ncbi:protein serine/threonine phosphatase 2C [Periconia macrospinosa]|uniref:Protein serine/threonine phosphatase 2C n=1 Tax=Periconia macrospinosa TaxID=97972 RepID=A0A2V1EE77_9PLEO|nr:protein serine/threonine phosphatase 2C [Periconia macrospinosa]
MTMSPRWQAAVRQLNRQNPLVAQSRTYLGPRTASCSLHTCTLVPRRVYPLQSRVLRLAQYSRSISSRRRSHAGKNEGTTRNTSPLALQSRFPTKTVLFLAVLGTAMYFLVSVEEFESTGGAQAHFFPNMDAVEHWLQNTAPPDFTHLSAMATAASHRFHEVVDGWQVPEEASRQFGIPITHGCRYEGNANCEDYYIFGSGPGVADRHWSYWSIFDGHAGHRTAHLLQTKMHPSLSRALYTLPPNTATSVIHDTIKSVFITLDRDIMTQARHAANWYPAASFSALLPLMNAFAGSCALVAAFDPEKNKLHVACTGDSRAVLGRWDELEGKYVAQPLSVDQTGFNESEVARIKAEHPDEPEILNPTTGRLLGLAVTRAFGDHRWKWDNDFVKACQVKFFGPAPRPHNATPPYLTAEPEITETDIIRADAPQTPNSRPTARSDFMIMASDGLWDHMSSDVAVACVSQWLEARARSPDGLVSNDPQRPPFHLSNTLDPGIHFSVEDGKEVTWQAEPQYFAIEDDNAAVCLTRNALGGTRRSLFSGILCLPPSVLRDATDDTTVMVVFFDRLAEPTVQEKKSWWWPF